MSILAEAIFHDEAAAFAYVENRVWPNGPVCPHCGSNEQVYALKNIRTKPSGKNPEGIIRHGLKVCGRCRRQFTVRIGTIFEESRLPLHKWLQAICLMDCAKDGLNAHQLFPILEVQYRTALFVYHRLLAGKEAYAAGLGEKPNLPYFAAIPAPDDVQLPDVGNAQWKNFATEALAIGADPSQANFDRVVDTIVVPPPPREQQMTYANGNQVAQSQVQ